MYLTNYQVKAEQLVIKANNKLNKNSGVLGIIRRFVYSYSSEDKEREAAELYREAGNVYNMIKDKDHQEEYLRKAAMLYLKTSNPFDAAPLYYEIGRIQYAKSPELAYKDYYQALELYQQNNNYLKTGELAEDCAKIAQHNQKDLKKAIELLNLAIDNYKAKDYTNKLIQCRIKLGDVYMLSQQYEKALYEFELSTENTKYKVLSNIEPYYKAMLAKLAIVYLLTNQGIQLYTIVDLRESLENYKQKASLFRNADQFNLIEHLILQIEDNNFELEYTFERYSTILNKNDIILISQIFEAVSNTVIDLT